MADLYLEDFEKALKKEAEKYVPKLARDKQIIASREIFRDIVEVTPVLTGQARRNWIPALDEATTETTKKVAGVNVTGAPMTSSERARINNVLKRLRGLPLREHKTVYIANNLSYIKRLDEGYSKKAPAGIVDVAIHGALEQMDVVVIRRS